MSIPRNEYPRPQLVRYNWLCLNGEWQFEIDNAKSGKEKELFNAESLSGKITVPFCPESELSGIGNTDFMYCVWYKRKVSIPKEWTDKHIILHIGAADYASSVYINGSLVTCHRGGYTPFSADITEYIQDGSCDITVCCEDDYSSSAQPFGKQSQKLHSNGCHYTRTTGIWQSVWLEAVNPVYIKALKLTPDADNSSISATITVSTPCDNLSLAMRVYYEGDLVGECSAVSSGCSFDMHSALSQTHLWEIGCGRLYDVELELSCGENILDTVKSYFGLRSVALKDNAFYLNNRPVFMRLVLDQGFYPDGIYTAPSDDALKADIVASMSLGFNGARLHQKVFEPRYIYWADKLGYLVWGEYGTWGLDHTSKDNIYNILPEWIESINRDYNHPSIIGWCPFNETWDIAGHRQSNDFIGLVYDVTKELDPTRPCIDTSGNYHVRTDIFDVHDYTQNPEEFAKVLELVDEGVVKDQIWRNYGPDRQTWRGEPLFISEYGGIKWVCGENDTGWGYGDAPETEDEFKARYKALTDMLLDCDKVTGFCYTQLYDVEQEVNGLMTYSREFKFAPEFFHEVNSRTAAIEKKNS